MNAPQLLPIPNFYNPEAIEKVWRVPYGERSTQAESWAKQHEIKPAAFDKARVCLLLIDVQNTFCLPEFELFVAGQSGKGAIEDSARLCELIYKNLGIVTEIVPTMDTHAAVQIFHPIFWINEAGEHPSPASLISLDEVEGGAWKTNPAIAPSLTGGDVEALQNYGYYYVKKLSDEGKYPLTVWPYHSMLGGIGHSLVSAVEEAIFFHSIARCSPTRFELKGNNPLTENYSVLRPEVLEDAKGLLKAAKNKALIDHLLEFDAVIIAGQAKSHCVAWTIDDLLTEIKAREPKLAGKVYLLDDCASAVVIPGIVDFTEQAEASYARFAEAGMHRVNSTDAIATWPDFPIN
ncbi:isochorismatase [Oscillatoria sp. FACHB-1406]|uniref:isochorismatase n=1 Tax=Oscillatoria sp. FACHB-1406 TaxID=2692846 RepID=UPI0016889354|nr:isochorismatase [Oscillatoria sp. FACHB-1406]MBD2578680.1 isochorismatase [Oscillatoria sp. FACHB-1406]